MPRFPHGVDELDQALLRALRDDGRAPFTDLAKRLGTSEGTVRARMKRLVADGIIERFTIRTGAAGVRGLVEVQVEPDEDTGIVADAVRSLDHVESVWEVTGEDDLIAMVDCPTTERLNATIDRIRGLPGAAATRSRLILKQH